GGRGRRPRGARAGREPADVGRAARQIVCHRHPGRTGEHPRQPAGVGAPRVQRNGDRALCQQHLRGDGPARRDPVRPPAPAVRPPGAAGGVVAAAVDELSERSPIRTAPAGVPLVARPRLAAVAPGLAILVALALVPFAVRDRYVLSVLILANLYAAMAASW